VAQVIKAGFPLESIKLSQLRQPHITTNLTLPLFTALMEETSGGSKLTSLDLSSCCLNHREGAALATLITTNSLPQLSHLILSDNRTLNNTSFIAIISGLEKGGCPLLKELDLSCNYCVSSVSRALVLAMSSLPLLEVLNCDGAFGENPEAAFTTLFQEMVQRRGGRGQPGKCYRQLKHLSISSYIAKRSTMKCLVTAFRSKLFPNLKSFSMNGWEMPPTLFKVLIMAQAVDLTKLHMDSVHFLFTKSMRFTSFEYRIQHVSLHRCLFDDHQGVDNVLYVLQQCRDLRHLAVSPVGETGR